MISAGMTLIQFENVGMRYGMNPEVLRDISFDLVAGSFHLLTGPSGAGKSSLLKLLYLAQKPSRGMITLFGRETAQLSRAELQAVRQKIGIVFQDFRLFDHMSALENVALPLRLVGQTDPEVTNHATELLSWVGLEDRMDACPATLSGGEQQRLAIARAVIRRPQLLLADEPTGNVDARIAERLIYLFKELNRMGTTVIIATHDQTLLEKAGAIELRLEGGTLMDPSRSLP